MCTKSRRLVGSYLKDLNLFIITEKSRVKERKWDGVGVMKDEEMKFEDVKVPEPDCIWEWGVWAWGGCGCVRYSAAVRYTIVIWSHKSRNKVCGGWSPQKTKGPECKWEGGKTRDRPKNQRTWVDVRVKSLGMGRVSVCMLLWYSQILYNHMVTEKEVRVLGGLVWAKKQRTWVQVRERSVVMGRVWVCILLCDGQKQYSHMVTHKQERDLAGLDYARNERTWVEVLWRSTTFVILPEWLHVRPCHVITTSVECPYLNLCLTLLSL